MQKTSRPKQLGKLVLHEHRGISSSKSIEMKNWFVNIFGHAENGRKTSFCKGFTPNIMYKINEMYQKRTNWKRPTKVEREINKNEMEFQENNMRTNERKFKPGWNVETLRLRERARVCVWERIKWKCIKLYFWMPKSFIISVPIGDAFVLPTPDCTRHRNAHAHKACIKRFVRKRKGCTYPNTNATPMVKLVTLKSNGKGENDFSNKNSRFVKINGVCVFARTSHLQGKS